MHCGALYLFILFSFIGETANAQIKPWTDYGDTSICHPVTKICRSVAPPHNKPGKAGFMTGVFDVDICNSTPNICTHKSPQGAKITVACFGSKCSKSITYLSDNKVIITFLETFDSGLSEWSNAAKILLKNISNKLLNNINDIQNITVFSHTDFEEVGDSIKSGAYKICLMPCTTPAGKNSDIIECKKQDNACLRKLRRHTTRENLINIVTKILGSFKVPVNFGQDYDDLRHTDKFYFNKELLKNIGAQDVFHKACHSVKKHKYPCTSNGFAKAFKHSIPLRNLLRKRFTPYRNAIIVVNYED
ncbi:MAG: hypothetical protein GY862_14275 [Gammaproteobacteria bacterium]|nr:hypothetical protein [Gammaproteobacteria bacterium]